MSLSERIKEQRKSAGLSQEKVAELVGVSRQAVTKWETGQSAPSTENLFKLAEIFGTNVDMLIRSEETGSPTPAEQIYYLYKLEEAEKKAARRARIKSNLLLALLILGGYIAVYLLGRVFGTKAENISLMGWLFGMHPRQLSYLYGWLLNQNLFWGSMAISIVPAAFGKKYFSAATLAGFSVGLLSGELLGPYPAGSATGMTHYGWLIWGAVFAISVIVGILLEVFAKKGMFCKKQQKKVVSKV